MTHHHHLLLLAKIAIVAGAALIASRADHNPRAHITLHTPQQRSPARLPLSTGISR